MHHALCFDVPPARQRTKGRLAGVDRRPERDAAHQQLLVARLDADVEEARAGDLGGAEWIRSGYPGDSSALPDLLKKAGLPPPRYRVDCPSFLMVPELVARTRAETAYNGLTTCTH